MWHKKYNTFILTLSTALCKYIISFNVHNFYIHFFYVASIYETQLLNPVIQVLVTSVIHGKHTFIKSFIIWSRTIYLLHWVTVTCSLIHFDSFLNLYFKKQFCLFNLLFAVYLLFIGRKYQSFKLDLGSILDVPNINNNNINMNKIISTALYNLIIDSLFSSDMMNQSFLWYVFNAKYCISFLHYTLQLFINESIFCVIFMGKYFFPIPHLTKNMKNICSIYRQSQTKWKANSYQALGLKGAGSSWHVHTSHFSPEDPLRFRVKVPDCSWFLEAKDVRKWEASPLSEQVL